MKPKTLRSAGNWRTPVTTMALALVAVVAPSPAASAADAGISIVGGDSTASVVCGNVAAAKELAARRGVVLQRSNCTADSAGGDVALQDVEIYISAAARTASPTNAAVAALASGASPHRTATDVCKKVSTRGTSGAQRNICWGKGFGGQARLAGTVVGVTHHADGRVTKRTFSASSLPVNQGSASANCANVVAELQNQQDTCTSSGAGALFSMRNVTVVQRRSDGSSVTRTNINVTVRGGKATSTTYCFNVTDGAGRVVQINHCKGTATGGDVTLANVTIHTTA